MKLALQGFAGEIPKAEPRYLPDQNGAVVSGARLTRGNLAPMREDNVVKNFGAAQQSIYVQEGVILGFPYKADIVPGPTQGTRLYITAPGEVPQVADATNPNSILYYPLALPAPLTAPVITPMGTYNPGLRETVLYAYTYVTSLGEESAPSPFSSAINWSPPQTVDVNIGFSPPPGRLVTHKRIYRSQTSLGGTTALFFVKQVPVATTSFLHDVVADPMQELIPTLDFDTPLNTLQGLTAMPNGMMVAFSGSEVFFCEPYQPHAWPQKYALATNDDIVGLVAFGTTVAILTTGTPYIAQGLHPDSMAMARMEVDLPCLSKRGIVDMGVAAIYPSTNGLVQISETGASLISAPLWDREQWTALAPATFRAAQYQGRYAFSFNPVGAASRRLAFLDLTGQMPFLIPVDDTIYIDLFHDLPTGRLLGLTEAGTQAKDVDPTTGNYRSYVWKSKPYIFPMPAGFAALQVDARPPDIGAPVFELRLIADGAVIATYTSPPRMARVPAGKYSEWEIRITGNYTVTRVILAGTPDEVFE